MSGGFVVFARSAALACAGLTLQLGCAHDSVGVEPPFAERKASGVTSEPSLTTASASSIASAAMPASPQPGSQPAEMPAAGSSVGGSGGVVAAPVASPVSQPCDLSGEWIAQHVTRNSALGAVQVATNWHYHRIAQQGARFQVMASVDCGFAVRGTTDASISDATLEAVAIRSLDATSVGGTFALSADGQSCALAFERTYAIRGADRARFLESVWKVGDPPQDLDAFTLPTSAADGMEDWDADGHEGVTQITGFGERYSAQLDWYASRGEAPLRATQFGGEGKLVLDYDVRESIAAETPALLQTTGTPMSPGYAFMARVDGELEQAAAQGKLQFCKQVQTLAIAEFGNPARP